MKMLKSQQVIHAAITLLALTGSLVAGSGFRLIFHSFRPETFVFTGAGAFGGAVGAVTQGALRDKVGVGTSLVLTPVATFLATVGITAILARGIPDRGIALGFGATAAITALAGAGATELIRYWRKQ